MKYKKENLKRSKEETSYIEEKRMELKEEQNLDLVFFFVLNFFCSPHTIQFLTIGCCVYY